MFGGPETGVDRHASRVWAPDVETFTIDDAVATLDHDALAAVARFLDRLERDGYLSREGAARWHSRLALRGVVVRQS